MIDALRVANYLRNPTADAAYLHLDPASLGPAGSFVAVPARNGTSLSVLPLA